MTEPHRVRLLLLRQDTGSGKDGHTYTVLQVNNSIDYRIGEVLGEKEVNYLCDEPEWQVIITGVVQ